MALQTDMQGNPIGPDNPILGNNLSTTARNYLAQFPSAQRSNALQGLREQQRQPGPSAERRAELAAQQNQRVAPPVAMARRSEDYASSWQRRNPMSGMGGDDDMIRRSAARDPNAIRPEAGENMGMPKSGIKSRNSEGARPRRGQQAQQPIRPVMPLPGESSAFPTQSGIQPPAMGQLVRPGMGGPQMVLPSGAQPGRSFSRADVEGQVQAGPLIGPPMGNPGFQGGTMSPGQMRQLPQFQALEAQQNALGQQQQQLLQGMPEYGQYMQMLQQLNGQAPSQEQIAAVRQLQQQISQNPQMQALQQQHMQLGQQYQQLAQPYMQAEPPGMGQMAKAMPAVFSPNPAFQQQGQMQQLLDQLGIDYRGNQANTLPQYQNPRLVGGGPAPNYGATIQKQSGPMMTPEQLANMPGPSLAHVYQPGMGGIGQPGQLGVQFPINSTYSTTTADMMRGRTGGTPGQTAAQGIGSLLGNFAQRQTASAQPPTQMQQTQQAAPQQAAPQPAGAGGFGQQNPQQPNYTASGGGGGGGMGGF